MSSDRDLLPKAAAALQLDVPILAFRRAGGRLELRLYGGRVVFWDIPRAAGKIRAQKASQTAAVDPNVLENPHRYDRKDLRALGQALGIANAATMNKIPLVQAIKAWKQANR